jgi:predicted phosphodiesterase
MARILAVSDTVDPSLYDHFNVDRWREAKIDLLISCGDLPAEYLSYLVDRFDLPLFYVHGNHDGNYDEVPPEGCECIDGRIVDWKGLRILGLGGAPKYNNGPQQYGETAMSMRILGMKPKIWRMGGLDLIVTHAPPRHCPLANGVCLTPAGVGGPCRLPEQSHRTICLDAPDRAHRGFPSFNALIEGYHPRVFLHGHSHLSYGQAKRVVDVGSTKVIDAHGYHVLEL